MTQAAIELQGLHKTYKGGQMALAGVDLSVPRAPSTACSAPTVPARAP